jgi:IS30 family transposase
MKIPMGCCVSTFPKYSDLSGYTPRHLADAATSLNNRPRQSLNDDTPAERFARLLNNHT